MIRVWEKWLCKKNQHTHHEKHVCADAEQQPVQLRGEHVEHHLVAANVGANVDLVDGGPGAYRGLSRLELYEEFEWLPAARARKALTS